MSSTDLTAISLDAFEETILTVDLLPSRRIADPGESPAWYRDSRWVSTTSRISGPASRRGATASLAAGLSVDECPHRAQPRGQLDMSAGVSRPTRRLRAAGTRTSARWPGSGRPRRSTNAHRPSDRQSIAPRTRPRRHTLAQPSSSRTGQDRWSCGPRLPTS